MLCTFHNVYFIVIFKIIFNFEFSYYLLFFLRQITKKKKTVEIRENRDYP